LARLSRSRWRLTLTRNRGHSYFLLFLFPCLFESRLARAPRHMPALIAFARGTPIGLPVNPESFASIRLTQPWRERGMGLALGRVA
jgi:hypothetical protein